MSYFRTIEYDMIPNTSFPVLHNCSGCGRKTHFINTGCFRVNANGSRIDVWLIYQCEKCKHTLNVTVYERQKASGILQEEYSRFLANDEVLADEYGTTTSFFTKNRLEIDWSEVSYRYVNAETGKQAPDESVTFREGDRIVIHNPHGIRLRSEKQAADVLGLSRNQVKKLIEEGKLVITQEQDGVCFLLR